MTKIYLVYKVVFVDGKLSNKNVESTFTNRKKAMSFKRWLELVIKEDEIKYPNLTKHHKEKVEIVEDRINTFDYEKAAIKLEMELLPY